MALDGCILSLERYPVARKVSSYLCCGGHLKSGSVGVNRPANDSTLKVSIPSNDTADMAEATLRTAGLVAINSKLLAIKKVRHS
jgi:hypothetical protein